MLGRYQPFLEQLVLAFGDEIAEWEQGWNQQQERIEESVKRGMDNSTGTPDLLYLYLVTRYLKPETTIEIGTWVGSSTYSMARAIEKNGSGRILTVDLNNHSLVPDELNRHITYYSGVHCDEALQKLKNNNVVADLIFLDAIVTRTTIELLNELVHDRTVVITHDYVPFTDKGCHALVGLDLDYRFRDESVLLTPEKEVNWVRFLKEPERFAFSYKVGANEINACCATLMNREDFRKACGVDFDVADSNYLTAKAKQVDGYCYSCDISDILASIERDFHQGSLSFVGVKPVGVSDVLQEDGEGVKGMHNCWYEYMLDRSSTKKTVVNGSGRWFVDGETLFLSVHDGTEYVLICVQDGDAPYLLGYFDTRDFRGGRESALGRLKRRARGHVGSMIRGMRRMLAARS